MEHISLEEFLHDFRQEILADAEANLDFLEAEFTQNICNELVDSGIVDGFEACNYRAPSGMRVDGYWFNEGDARLDLFITDFSNRESVDTLTKTDVNSIIKRLENFFIASANKNLFNSLEETAPGFGLSSQISGKKNSLSRVNFYLISERSLSERLQELEDKEQDKWTFTYHIWDLSRLYRLKTSRGGREELQIDLVQMTGDGLPCLSAHLKSASYRSYLIVVPGSLLNDLYSQYGSRLLEQNVRSFLQARGNVNKGIRATIINDPEMFFAYNNGITATAKEVEIEERDTGLFIISIKDLQIVNGGQTTASLFHTHRKDKAPLNNVFVQMKLSVVDEEKTEEVVPKISEFANTQNKVNAADFFSNHPFHVRAEEFSRRIWAPAQQGSQRETKWFYERARGQYSDAQSNLTSSEKRRFQVEYPKSQMFLKTDLAKFENVWDENPRFVNLGAQKNFVQYASRIGKEWEKSPNNFNELYFKRIVARALIFRKTEKLVSGQEWYSGGYRANVVAYTLGLLGYHASANSKAIDFISIWDRQCIPETLERAITITAKLVHEDLTTPPHGISNITEWAKREGCWQRLQGRIEELNRLLPDSYKVFLISKDVVNERNQDARNIQTIDNSIEAQLRVMEIAGPEWNRIVVFGLQKKIFGPKEVGILKIAAQIPNKSPSEKQCIALVKILEKVKQEGFE